MPVIVIENYLPSVTLPNGTSVGEGDRLDVLWRRHVRKAIAEACLAAKVPGITERHHVTTIFGEQFDDYCPPDQRNPTMAIIFVEGLYDTPERTTDVRQVLAIGLGATLHAFLPSGWSVEVIPKRYQPLKEGAVTITATGMVVACNPHKPAQTG